MRLCGYSFAQLCAEIERYCRENWSELGARLEFCWDAGVAAGVRVDFKWLKKIFPALISDSIAFQVGHQPRIRISGGVAVREGRSSLWLRYEDNGPGVPAGSKERIFEPFYTTRAKGTGVGLTDVREIVRMHGGTIVETGDKLKGLGGVCFEITLPTNC